MIYCRPHRRANLPIQLVQVDTDLVQTDTRAERDLWLDLKAKGYRTSGWRHHHLNLAPGIYCRHCLAAGNEHPLPVDEFDIEDANLIMEPLIFRDADSFKVEEVWPAIHDRFAGSYVDHQDTTAAPAKFGPWAPSLSPLARKALARKFRAEEFQLYRHQAKAVELSLAGHDVVIETATASGKSLAYTVPILQEVLSDERATALYISPLNALSEDQLASFTGYDESGTDWAGQAAEDPLATYLREITVSGKRIRVARYDGEVNTAYRDPIRKRIPNVLVTNPDMLHMGILPNAQAWGEFLRRLRYVVIDELHVYRGIFGAHVTNVLRRLRRICAALGANPQFICCSATIHNPIDLAETVTGRRPQLVGHSEDGSPRRLRRLVLLDTGASGDTINTQAKNLMLELMATHRLKTIAFMRSIPGVRGLDYYMREDLDERFQRKLSERIHAGYYRGLHPDDKRAITRGLQDGRLHGVISTTALQMGIDIGDLSAALLVKYPGSMSALYQQAGRVGRKGEGLVFVLLDKDPLNQFFARHPEEFFAMRSEEVYLDPENPYVALDHLCCAAKERALHPTEDRTYWGENLPAFLETLVTAGRLIQAPDGRYELSPDSGSPAHSLPLRGVGFEVSVMHNREELMTEDSARAPRSLHKYARFTHEDDVYEVTALHLNETEKEGRATVRKVPNPDFVTVPSSEYATLIIRDDDSRNVSGIQVAYGDIRLSMDVQGYYKVPVSAKQLHQKPEYQALGPAAPPKQAYQTSALWFTLTPEHYGAMGPIERKAGARSLQKALALGTCVVLRADLADVAGQEIVQNLDSDPQIFLFDTTPGGNGLSAKVFGRLPEIFAMAHKILKECPYCSTHPDSRGCARCVSEEWGDENSIDRHAAMRLLEALMKGA